MFCGVGEMGGGGSRFRVVPLIINFILLPLYFLCVNHSVFAIFIGQSGK